MRPGSRPPAVVEISAAPTTLSPNSSGYCSASEMTLMPPIEWPTTTQRPGTVSSMTRRRSWPSWSIVQWSSLERAERPWLRWS